MLRSLDLAPILSTPQEERAPGFYLLWRPYFYGTLDPISFIGNSVNLELEGTSAYNAALAQDKPKRRGRPKKSIPRVALEGAFEEGSVVCWLSKVKSLLEQNDGALEPKVVKEMVDGLKSAYNASSNARERAQIAYVLRTLGYSFLSNPEAQDELYSVVMEYDSDGSTSSGLGLGLGAGFNAGPTLVFASCDSFAFSYWHSGCAKWSSFDRGEGTVLVEKIGALGRDLLERSKAGDNSSLNIETLEDGELPALPASPTPSTPSTPSASSDSPSIRFSFVTSSGVKTIGFASKDAIGQEFKGLYKLFMELGRVLGSGREDNLLDPGSGVGKPKPVYPLQLGTMGGLLAPLSSRWIALLIDIGVYGVIFSLILYFFSSMTHGWGFLPATVFYGFILFLLPLLGAWMESSAEWGYATIGKRLMGIHVHGLESDNISLPQALARNMSKYVLSPMFMFCGYVWALFNPSQRTWHDLLADTVVLDGSDNPFMIFSTVRESGGESTNENSGPDFSR